MTERGIDRARADLAARKASGELDDFVKKMERVLAMGMKLKTVMLKRGITVAKARCAQCEGYLHGRLAGRRNHLHMYCDGPCKARMME